MASPCRKRILFLAEGATMAHFVRPLALAQTLDPGQYEVLFYAPARYSRFLRQKPFEVGELPTMPGEQLLANIARGKPMFPPAVLRDYVKQDAELLRRLRPDLVIGDLRLSLPISGRLEHVPVALMMNAYWSPYAKHYAILPEIPLTRVIPPRFLGWLYRLSEPFAYAAHVGEMNRVRRQFGIAPLPPDLRLMYTDGEYVLYPDIPEFIPTTGMPGNHVFVGTCEWRAPVQLPVWWDEMVADRRPKVFVSLGSSGPMRALPAVLQALAGLPVAVVLSTSGREVPPGASPAWTAELLPFTETASVAAAVVSHGGSGGLYPALAAGTPVLGIPSNADQHLSTAFLEDSGAGLGVRVEEASQDRLRRALERLLSEPQFSSSAKQWAAVSARYDSGQMFRAFLSSVFGEG